MPKGFSYLNAFGDGGILGGLFDGDGFAAHSLTPRFGLRRQLLERLHRLSVHFRAQGQEAGQEFASVAYQDSVADYFRQLSLDSVLDEDGRDVFAARGDNQLLDTARDTDVAFAVFLAHVARVQPAVVVEDLSRLLLVE
jgi:hypothetical protein